MSGGYWCQVLNLHDDWLLYYPEWRTYVGNETGAETTTSSLKLWEHFYKSVVLREMTVNIAGAVYAPNRVNKSRGTDGSTRN